MRLFILLFFCFHGICWTSGDYCVHQPKILHVKEGDSVTIPCSYGNSDKRRGKSQIIVTWGEGYEPFCYIIREYITDGSGYINDEYKDRISAVNHPDNQTATIVIRGLKPSDGTTFCCRVYVVNARYEYYDRYGTFLNLADGKWLSQVEELIAVPGEELVIPCHYPLKTLEEALQVTWYRGKDELCEYNSEKIYKWDQNTIIDGDEFSLVNISKDFSLRIHRVQSNGGHHYCCRMTSSDKKEIKSRISTELIIAGPSSSSSPFNVTQPYNITGHREESMTLSCSYSRYMESDVLGVNIYWRVGSTSGPYVYHPYKEMIHPDYRGRTGIQGEADLQIRGLQMSDGFMYYCFVMIRLCPEYGQYQTLVQYGGGTRLIVTGVISKKKNVYREMRMAGNPENVEFVLEEDLYDDISTGSIENNQAAGCTEETNENEMQGEKDEPESDFKVCIKSSRDRNFSQLMFVTRDWQSFEKFSSFAEVRQEI